MVSVIREVDRGGGSRIQLYVYVESWVGQPGPSESWSMPSKNGVNVYKQTGDFNLSPAFAAAEVNHEACVASHGLRTQSATQTEDSPGFLDV